jgi:hypothetical protein
MLCVVLLLLTSFLELDSFDIQGSGKVSPHSIQTGLRMYYQ